MEVQGNNKTPSIKEIGLHNSKIMEMVVEMDVEEVVRMEIIVPFARYVLNMDTLLYSAINFLIGSLLQIKLEIRTIDDHSFLEVFL